MVSSLARGDTLRRSNPLFREIIYREAFEWNAARGWAICDFFMIGMLSSSWAGLSNSGRMLYGGLIGYVALMVLKNLIAAYPVLKAQARMFCTGMLFMQAAEVRLHNGVGNKKGADLIVTDDGYETLLAEGFEWGTEHTNQAYKIINMDSKKSQIVMPLPVRWYVQSKLEETRQMGGQPWIYNLGVPSLQKIRADNWFGHTLVTGNVGTGKTTLLRLLSCSAIHMGHVVLALDPKNDEDWRDAMKAECEALGLPFYSFHPSQASRSVAIDPLCNYVRETDIASRISGIVSDASKADSFRDFGWYAIYRATLGCIYISEKPTLLRLYRYISSDKDIFCKKVLERYFDVNLEAGWREKLKNQIKGEWLEGLVSIYETKYKENKPAEAVNQIVALYRHPHEHYQKMIISTLPLFANLTAAPLDELLSPEDSADEPRTIINLKSLFDTGGVLHIGLDSLSDPQTAQRLVQLLVADAAAIAGSRYNTGLEGARRVSLYFDEAHAALCEQLLSLLAQGRASKMGMTVVTQTIPDLIAKSSQAVADRVIGLCNNWITTRISDPTTQDKMARNFADVSVEDREVSVSQRFSTNESMHDFGGGFSEKMSKKDKQGFPPALLGDLPKLQAIARLADGRKMILKIPVITREAA